MSRELEKTYDPKKIERKLYDRWCENKYFHAEVDRSRKPFTTVMPPPNITGKLHMGHALDNTLQDILIRYKRMEGYNALWIPGTDHAAIAGLVLLTATRVTSRRSRPLLLHASCMFFSTSSRLSFSIFKPPCR